MVVVGGVNVWCGGGFSFGGSLWYTGPRSSSLALVGLCELFKVFREFWRVRAR